MLTLTGSLRRHRAMSSIIVSTTSAIIKQITYTNVTTLVYAASNEHLQVLMFN